MHYSWNIMVLCKYTCWRQIYHIHTHCLVYKRLCRITNRGVTTWRADRGRLEKDIVECVKHMHIFATTDYKISASMYPGKTGVETVWQQALTYSPNVRVHTICGEITVCFTLWSIKLIIYYPIIISWWPLWTWTSYTLEVSSSEATDLGLFHIQLHLTCLQREINWELTV